jgi:hypothetical protein
LKAFAEETALILDTRKNGVFAKVVPQSICGIDGDFAVVEVL